VCCVAPQPAGVPLRECFAWASGGGQRWRKVALAMSKKTVELMLVENVESLGIVGDDVKVKIGYARNYLLPRGLATVPSDELKAELADKRKKAQEEMAALRASREKMISEIEGTTLTVVRACNDQGLLYGSVTQQDLAAMIADMGHPVRDRDVRLGQVIKRVGEYDITVKPEQDLETTVHVKVEPEGGMIIEDEEPEETGESESGEGEGEDAVGEADGGADAASESSEAEEAERS